MAAAIWDGDPSRLRPAAPPPRSQPTPTPPHRDLAPAPKPRSVTPEAASPPSRPAAIREATSPAEAEAVGRPTTLSEPASRFERFLQAGAADRALEVRPGAGSPLTEAEGRYLVGLAKQALDDLEALSQGESPRARQLAVKRELIRAWMAAYFPVQSVLQQIRPLGNLTIPPLLFVLEIDPEAWRRASRYSPAAFREMLDACAAPEALWRNDQRAALKQWADSPAILALRNASRG